MPPRCGRAAGRALAGDDRRHVHARLDGARARHASCSRRRTHGPTSGRRVGDLAAATRSASTLYRPPPRRLLLPRSRASRRQTSDWSNGVARVVVRRRPSSAVTLDVDDYRRRHPARRPPRAAAAVAPRAATSSRVLVAARALPRRPTRSRTPVPRCADADALVGGRARAQLRRAVLPVGVRARSRRERGRSLRDGCRPTAVAAACSRGAP